jgi:hypothetical protein
MTTMYDKLQGVDRYPFSENALFEPTVRLPYALHSPAIITHIPLFDKSQEDFNFEEQSRLLREFFKKDGNKLIPSSPGDEEINELIRNYRVIGSAPDRADIEKVIHAAWGAARKSFERIVTDHPERDHPEYVIFRSKSLLSRDINRDAHTAIVNRIKRARDKDSPHKQSYAVWRSDFVNKNAYPLVNATLHLILQKIDAFIDAFRKDHPPSNLARQSLPKQDILGGLLSWMTELEFSSNSQSKETGRRFFKLGDEKQAPEIGESNTVVDEYLVWRRGEQNWRYTFYDGLYEYPKEGSALRLTKFIERLLASADLESSFPSSDALKQALGDEAVAAYRLPGTRIGGAQYFMIPAELLLVLLACFPDIVRLAGSSAKDNSNLRTADGRPASECIEAIFEIDQTSLKQETPTLKSLIGDGNIDSSAALTELLNSMKKRLGRLVGAPGARNEVPQPVLLFLCRRCGTVLEIDLFRDLAALWT